MKTEQELRDKLAELRQRLEHATRAALPSLGAMISVLEWALGEENQ